MPTAGAAVIGVAAFGKEAGEAVAAEAAAAVLVAGAMAGTVATCKHRTSFAAKEKTDGVPGTCPAHHCY